MLMHIYASSTFADLPPMIIRDFVEKSEEVDVGEWQSTDIKGDRSKVTWELREASLHFGMTDFVVEAVRDIQPNLPWAEDHFQERISGMPLNPPPSQAWWPSDSGLSMRAMIGLIVPRSPKSKIRSNRAITATIGTVGMGIAGVFALDMVITMTY
jgi:hypothetical protein